MPEKIVREEPKRREPGLYALREMPPHTVEHTPIVREEPRTFPAEPGRREPGIYALPERPPHTAQPPGIVGGEMLPPGQRNPMWVSGRDTPFTPEALRRAYRAYQEYIGEPMRRLGGVVERAVFPPRVDTSDLTRDVVDRVLSGATDVGYRDDYATRIEGRTRPSAPVVPPTSLESVWGITREVLPSGEIRYTLPGGEGTMTVSPTGGDDEAARRGVLGRARAEQAARERGIATQYANVERLREEAIQRQRYEEAAAERQRRRDLGLEPKLGYEAYEEAARRMREGVIPPKERVPIETARIGAVTEREKARLASEGVVATAGVKAQTEAAKLGLQAADLKSKIQYRQAMMDKMAAETGLLEPMKLRLQDARDATERAKIQQDAYSLASRIMYDNALRVLQDQYNMNQIDTPTYNERFQLLTQEFARQQEDIKDMYPIEGRIHSTIPAVWRGGRWVKIPKKEAE